MRMLKWLSSSGNIWEQIEKLNFEWHVQLILRVNSSILNSFLKNEVPLKSNITTPNVSTNCVHVHQHFFCELFYCFTCRKSPLSNICTAFLACLGQKSYAQTIWRLAFCTMSIFYSTIGKSPFDIEIGIFIVCWK